MARGVTLGAVPAQDELAPALAAVSKRLVVIAVAPGAFDADFARHACSLLAMVLPGQQERSAVDILLTNFRRTLRGWIGSERGVGEVSMRRVFWYLGDRHRPSASAVGMSRRC